MIDGRGGRTAWDTGFRQALTRTRRRRRTRKSTEFTILGLAPACQEHVFHHDHSRPGSKRRASVPSGPSGHSPMPLGWPRSHRFEETRGDPTPGPANGQAVAMPVLRIGLSQLVQLAENPRNPRHPRLLLRVLAWTSRNRLALLRRMKLRLVAKMATPRGGGWWLGRLEGRRRRGSAKSAVSHRPGAADTFADVDAHFHSLGFSRCWGRGGRGRFRQERAATDARRSACGRRVFLGGREEVDFPIRARPGEPVLPDFSDGPRNRGHVSCFPRDRQDDVRMDPSRRCRK